jgi:hypothetical protein
MICVNYLTQDRRNSCSRLPAVSEDIMNASLIAALRESCGYLQDEGWHQTARLMVLAALEIESLSECIQELEEHLRSLDEASDTLRTPEASNQNARRAAAVSSRR